MTSHRARIVSDHCRWLASDETGMDIRSVVPSCPAYVAKYWHSVPESILAPVVCNFREKTSTVLVPVCHQMTLLE